MAIIDNNLYPPLVAQTMPAFIRTQGCRIYFSLSTYTSEANIKNVQISLVNQKTNASALKTTDYPSGIKIANMIYDPDKKGNYKYYVRIDPSDLNDGEFKINQFYKVQLRFTSTAAPNPPDKGKGIATWLYNNMQHFSEWSRVCLIKGIEQPIIKLRDFSSDMTEEASQETILTNLTVQIIGKLTYSQSSIVETETEYLKSYNIKIYQTNNPDAIAVQSEEIYTNPHNPNQINYLVTQTLVDSVNYTLVLTYTTNNLYTESLYYNFSIVEHGIDKLNVNITATADEENGRIKVNIISTDGIPFIGNFTIRRTSSESNFHKWEDVKTVVYITGKKIDFEWYDSTIQSGVWYKYCVQRRNSRGDRGVITQTDDPVMCVLDHIFLTKKDCQLKIKFNPSLNEFKYNVTESQQVTIGAKYPFITRNSNNYFRSFPIGGLISSFVDTSDWYDPHFYDGRFHDDEDEIKAFTSKEEIYGDTKQLYDLYNDRHDVDQYNDYIYEREFRNKVYDFLYKHDVKLFRSTTEGNILVKLMNIDFQPVESLGRRLYSFTATAVQVDEATIENYQKYDIQVIGDYEEYISYNHNVLGQMQGTYSASSGNLLTKINEKHKKMVSAGFIGQVESLKWLRLEIEYDPNIPETQPYMIIDKDGQLIKADASSEFDPKNVTLGYIVIINGEEMIIYPRIQRRPITDPADGSNPAKKYADTQVGILRVGMFELKEPSTEVTELRFKYPTVATIDYIALLNEIEDTSRLVKKYYYYKKPGQFYGTFNIDDSIMRKIYNRYLIKYKKYYQKLLDLFDLRIEATPGAVVYIKDFKDTDFNRHVLENGYLQLKDDSATIEGIYFCGVHLHECTNLFVVNGITERDFVLQQGIYEHFDEIENPVNGGIYQFLSYGLKEGASLQNHRILIVQEDMVQYKEVTPDTLYTLLLDIADDDKLKFVYYYGSWYLLSDSYEKTKLLQSELDTRQLRDDEFVYMNDVQYKSFDDIKKPVKNGVYWVSVVDNNAVNVSDIDIPPEGNPDENGVLTGGPNIVELNSPIEETNRKYTLIMEKIYEESENRFIYYHGNWYHFTENHDVLCPVDGIIDYNFELVKGIY